MRYRLALSVGSLRPHRGLRAILPGACHFLWDRNAGGRIPAGRRASLTSLHSESRRQPSGYARIYGAGVFFVAAAGADSARIAGLVYFSSSRTRDALILGSALAIIAAMEIHSPVQWSPYYRITYVPRPEGSYRLDVDDFYQDLLNLGPSSSTLALQGPRRYYDFPYSLLPPCGRVLIIGAGTGNDVAAALRAQCASVNAVEIDPAMANLGRQLHPEHPYDSSKVRLRIQ